MIFGMVFGIVMVFIPNLGIILNNIERKDTAFTQIDLLL